MAGEEKRSRRGRTVYAIVIDDEDRMTVRFGDGATGARPPPGREQVAAIYRRGAGRSGAILGQDNADGETADSRASDLVYLDVWQRHTTAMEDPGIREPALGESKKGRHQQFWSSGEPWKSSGTGKSVTVLTWASR